MKMHCSMAMVLIVVVVVVGSLTLTQFGGVEGRFANTKLNGSPECMGPSDKTNYNKFASHLVDFLVDETKNVLRNRDDGSFAYSHCYPDPSSGSATGSTTCDRQLGKMDCWTCLVAAKNQLHFSCGHNPLGAAVNLTDCTLSFRMVP